MTCRWRLDFALSLLIAAECLSRCCNSELFTSVANLETLVDYQFEFAKLLRNHISSSEQYIKELKISPTDANVCSGNKSNCSLNPVDLFNSLERLTTKWRNRKYFIDKLSKERKSELFMITYFMITY